MKLGFALHISLLCVPRVNIYLNSVVMFYNSLEDLKNSSLKHLPSWNTF